MLTGDRKEVAEHVAESLGLDEYHAELLPDGKVKHLESLLASKEPGTTLAFVGDGINDAPVLALADTGIAMGGLGSDAALEAADVVVMDDKPSKVALAIRIARRTIGIRFLEQMAKAKAEFKRLTEPVVAEPQRRSARSVRRAARATRQQTRAN